MQSAPFSEQPVTTCHCNALQNLCGYLQIYCVCLVTDKQMRHGQLHLHDTLMLSAAAGTGASLDMHHAIIEGPSNSKKKMQPQRLLNGDLPHR